MIIYEKRGAQAWVRIDRPAKRNALTVEMRSRIAEAFGAADRDDEVRSIVLCGAGEAFCAGADIQLMGGRGMDAGRQRMLHLHSMIKAVYHSEKPVVAAVQGAAVGVGWSLALSCDAIVASEDARFAQVFRQLALAPDGGAIYLLCRQVGERTARDLVLSGRFVGARQAMEMGLVNEVVPRNALDQRAGELAALYGSGSLFATRLTKRLFQSAATLSFDEFLEQERLVQPMLTQAPDHEEGRKSFAEKRAPRFI